MGDPSERVLRMQCLDLAQRTLSHTGLDYKRVIIVADAFADFVINREVPPLPAPPGEPPAA